MIKSTTLISKLVINPKEANTIGTVFSILYNKKLNKATHLVILYEDDNDDIKTVPISEIVSNSLDAVIIRSSAKIFPLRFMKMDQRLNSPVNKKCYNTDGIYQGVVRDIDLDDNFNVVNIIVDELMFKPIDIASASEELIMTYGSYIPFKKKQYKSKEYPLNNTLFNESPIEEENDLSINEKEKENEGLNEAVPEEFNEKGNEPVNENLHNTGDLTDNETIKNIADKYKDYYETVKEKEEVKPLTDILDVKNEMIKEESPVKEKEPEIKSVSEQKPIQVNDNVNSKIIDKESYFKQENEKIKTDRIFVNEEINNDYTMVRNEVPPYKIVANYDFLLGRTVKNNIYNYDLKLIITKGTIITNDVVKIARYNNKLVELVSSSFV